VVAPSAATGNREVVLDVAHNPAGAWALRSALSENFANRPVTLLFGAMRDKAIEEMTQILFPVAEQVVVAQVNNPRAATTEELVEAGTRTGAQLHAEQSVADAVAKAIELTGPQGLMVVTGSIFLVGEAMAVLGLKA